MEYTLVEYTAAQTPHDWRVEAIDADRDGVIYVTIFVGTDAYIRAVEYAALKNAIAAAAHAQASADAAHQRTLGSPYAPYPWVPGVS